MTMKFGDDYITIPRAKLRSNIGPMAARDEDEFVTERDEPAQWARQTRAEGAMSGSTEMRDPAAYLSGAFEADHARHPDEWNADLPYRDDPYGEKMVAVAVPAPRRAVAVPVRGRSEVESALGSASGGGDASFVAERGDPAQWARQARAEESMRGSPEIRDPSKYLAHAFDVAAVKQPPSETERAFMGSPRLPDLSRFADRMELLDAARNAPQPAREPGAGLSPEAAQAARAIGGRPAPMDMDALVRRLGAVDRPPPALPRIVVPQRLIPKEQLRSIIGTVPGPVAMVEPTPTEPPAAPAEAFEAESGYSARRGPGPDFKRYFIDGPAGVAGEGSKSKADPAQVDAKAAPAVVLPKAAVPAKAGAKMSEADMRAFIEGDRARTAERHVFGAHEAPAAPPQGASKEEMMRFAEPAKAPVDPKTLITAKPNTVPTIRWPGAAGGGGGGGGRSSASFSTTISQGAPADVKGNIENAVDFAKASAEANTLSRTGYNVRDVEPTEQAAEVAQRAGREAYLAASRQGLSAEQATDAGVKAAAEAKKDFLADRNNWKERHVKGTYEMSEDVLKGGHEKLTEAEGNRAKNEGDRQKAIDAMEAQPKDVSANRLMDNMSAGRKALAVIGQMMGAYSASILRTPNFAQKIIDDAIEQDIQEQKANIAQRNTAIGQARMSQEEQRKADAMIKAEVLDRMARGLREIQAKAESPAERERLGALALKYTLDGAHSLSEAASSNRNSISVGAGAGGRGGGGGGGAGAKIPEGEDGKLLYRASDGTLMRGYDDQEARDIRKEEGIRNTVRGTVAELKELGSSFGSRVWPDEDRAKFESKAAALVQRLAGTLHGRVTNRTVEEFKDYIVTPLNLLNPNNLARLDAIAEEVDSHYASVADSALGRPVQSQDFVAPNGVRTERLFLTGEDRGRREPEVRPVGGKK